ncbi:MAG: hypothetical protein M1837_006166 [Sclerophora amabilis]|nr:MAG: hypothetical protein M1837_006166 [Sclerophora amabilis]
MGVIPIVNENDTIAVTEIKFGDNDTLSAITAAMVQADYLFLMTDVDCLYDRNPRTSPDAKPIEVVEDITTLAVDVSSAGSALGTGGMSTKLVAARLATSAGVTTVITRSSKPGNIPNIVSYVQALKTQPQSPSLSPTPTTTVPPRAEPISSAPAFSTNTTAPTTNNAPSVSSTNASIPSHPPHTRFLPSRHPIRDRYFWLLYGLSPHGTIYVDAGAHRALVSKAGLLPVGIVGVEGNFAQQEAVRLVVIATSHPPSHNPSRPPSSSSSSADAHNSSDTSTSTATKAVATATSATTAVAHSFLHPDNTEHEIGRAVVNYSAAEIARIKGLRSTEIHAVLGYADSEYVALRENVGLFGRDGREKGGESATSTGGSAS